MLRLVFLLVLATNVNAATVFNLGKQGLRSVNFDRFNNTCGKRNLPGILNIDGLSCEDGKLLMNTTAYGRRPIGMDLYALLYVKRCKNKENLDTCEHFFNHKIDDLCGLIEQKHALWSPLFDAYHPPLKCPVLKGVYHAYNSKVDVAALLMFPLDAWYWKVRMEVMDRDTEDFVTCLLIEARIATS